jgi:hypothetical protein
MNRTLTHLFFLILFLSGCTAVSPSKLGISQADWEEYSPTKQEQLISAYEETQANKGVAQKTQKSKRNQASESLLLVKIAGGKVLFPPYKALASYMPIDFTVRQGDCRKKIPVTPTDTDKKEGKLAVCYQDDILYLDPSPYEPALAIGSLKFPYMPVWQRGFTYPNVTSTGLLKLTDVHITLHELSPTHAQ